MMATFSFMAELVWIFYAQDTHRYDIVQYSSFHVKILLKNVRFEFDKKGVVTKLCESVIWMNYAFI